jgi:uncharacterized protein YkwD
MQMPILHGNWIDFIIILILSFYIFEGTGRGFLLGFIDVAGFLLSFIVSLKSYGFVGELLVANFSFPPGIARAIGFLLSGFLTEFLFSALILFLYRKSYPFVMHKIEGKKMVRITKINKILGILPAIGEALIFTSFILTLLIALPIQGVIKKSIISSRIGSVLVAKTQGVEKNLNSIFGEAVHETLNFLTISSSPTSSDRVNLHYTQTEVRIDEQAEQTMFQLVNQEREKQGLAKLTFSFTLRDLSREYAKDMFANGFFSHYDQQGRSPFDRMKERNISFMAAGENLALAPDVTLAHNGLMNSPGHRANILSADFGKVGIGVVDGGIYGQMFVQEFTD